MKEWSKKGKDRSGPIWTDTNGFEVHDANHYTTLPFMIFNVLFMIDNVLVIMD